MKQEKHPGLNATIAALLTNDGVGMLRKAVLLSELVTTCNPNWSKETIEEYIQEHSLDKDEPVFTIDEIKSYFEGWKMGTFVDGNWNASEDTHNTFLSNGFSQIDCDQDGIAAVTKRGKKN